MAAELPAESDSGAAVAAAAGGVGGQHHPPQSPVAPGAFTLDQPSNTADSVPAGPTPSGQALRARLSLPPLPVAAPHVKTHHYCVTPDGWRLHLVRTHVVQQPQPQPQPQPAAAAGPPAPAVGGSTRRKRPQQPQHSPQPHLQQPQQQPQPQQPPAAAPLPVRRCPVVLVPGLGSSGAYTFDLSPVVSLADYLAARGWDVWVVELRGNGQSDRPSLWSGRSRWWSVDDYVAKDLPAVLRHVLRETCCAQAHLVGHSMGGMVLTRLLALGGEAAAGVASATVVASGCFLKGSWWQMLRSTMWLARYLWIVPAGSTLRAYSPLAMGRAGLPLLDELYFWPPNTDPALARAVLARNFSAISSGVILQMKSAFGSAGLRTADGKEAFADPARLSRVETPVLFVCGDRDRMCPPQGAAATAAMFRGSRCCRYIELGPSAPAPGHTRTHYGHFDILMGRNAEEEVFPLLSDWLDEQDGGPADNEAAAAAAAASARSKAAAAANAPGHHQHQHQHHQRQPSHPPHHPAHPRHQHHQYQHQQQQQQQQQVQEQEHSHVGSHAADSSSSSSSSSGRGGSRATSAPAVAMAAAAGWDPTGLDWAPVGGGGHAAAHVTPPAIAWPDRGAAAHPTVLVLRSRL